MPDRLEEILARLRERYPTDSIEREARKVICRICGAKAHITDAGRLEIICDSRKHFPAPAPAPVPVRHGGDDDEREEWWKR